MKRRLKRSVQRLRARFHFRLRMLRLHFVRLPKPADAKTPEEMLAEIKRRSKLT